MYRKTDGFLLDAHLRFFHDSYVFIEVVNFSKWDFVCLLTTQVCGYLPLMCNDGRKFNRVSSFVLKPLFFVAYFQSVSRSFGKIEASTSLFIFAHIRVVIIKMRIHGWKSVFNTQTSEFPSVHSFSKEKFWRFFSGFLLGKIWKNQWPDLY